MQRSRSFGLPTVVVSSVLLLCVRLALADDGAEYRTKIKPVLQERCYACHGALKQESNLRLDTASAAIRGGDDGAAIKPGEPEASPLLTRIASPDMSLRMPPEGEPLQAEQIEAIRQWITRGAKSIENETPEADPREHWAFKVPVRPPVPVAKNNEWNHNPIDALIAQKHEQFGLTPQLPADKRVWLRRVSLDLVGLPPTLEEQSAFIADQSPEAYDTVVNRLLSSPQYGERWGRHWMDIWRYSDWWGLGAEVRNSQKHIWHWRDWIVESLNADKGYDQMLREMLAADELYPTDPDRLRASGFLARQYFKFNRTSWLDETIEHTSKAMLGLTVNCCKCHDHKYDPLSQVNYYQLRAVFEPYQVRTDAVPGEIDFEKDGIPRAYDCNLNAETFVHIRGDDRRPDTERKITPAVPEFLSFDTVTFEPIPLPPEAYLPGSRSFVVEGHRQAAVAKVHAAKTAIERERQKLATAELALKLAAEMPPVPATVEEPKVLVQEDFAEPKPDLWEPRDGVWTHENGKLKQSKVGATQTALRLKPLPPADFEARLKYIPLGGEMWKSVGIVFDVSESGHALSAYLSCYAEGSKAQVAYKQGADYVYPAEGAQARPIALNQPHEMILRVRGTLVNVTVDGEPSIAYRLPIPRQPGALELITFDAQAEFVSFELRDLPASVQMVEARIAPGTPDVAVPIEQAQLAVLVAEKALTTAEDQLSSLNQRAVADQSRTQHSASSNLPEIIRAAARAEKRAAVAQADEELCRADLSVKQATAEQKADREAKRTASRLALESAQLALEFPGDSYTSIPGALKTLENNLETEESRRKPFPTTSTGRRSALAKWITDPRHPLPARVAVNHIWSRHMGRPLVPTVFDFGRKGTPPVNQELLDWLAVELVESGWSMKHIHRLIVTSRAYRLSSSNRGASEANLTRDPENKYHWRANPIRMEAQTVRDSLLHLAGELDLKRGGPSIPVADETSRRRSLYFVHSHNEHQKFLSMFDDASVLDCYRRTESIVPQQALALENSTLASAMAEKITARITATRPELNDSDWVREAFVTVLASEPTPEELTISVEALSQFHQLATAANQNPPLDAARVQFILALLNHNDFVTVR